MDCKNEGEDVKSTDNKVTLSPDIVKTEPEDYPEFINETDLKPDNYMGNEDNSKSVWESNKDLSANERYSCSQCHEEFPELKYIQVHEAVHDQNMHCPVCDRIFKSRRYFVLHIQVHLKDPLRCQQCPEIFFDKRAYNLHLYTHKKNKTYTCDYCLKEWGNKKDLVVHIRVHTNERPYSCGVCGKSFKQKGGLTSHISTLHFSQKKGVRKKFDCDICNGSYSSVSSLNKHMRRIHEAGKTFPCRNCGETFLNFQQMKEHKRQAHPELVYNRVCALCNKTFSCRESFAKHKVIHTETGKGMDDQNSAASVATPMDCYLCGDQIQGIKAFSKHQQFHLLMTDDEIEACTQTNHFNCKICGKEFNSKKNLLRHMDIHLEKKFECKDHCSQTFTYLGIRLHLQWHFEQFHCAQCDETFIGKKSLIRHYKKHKATKQFSCKICGYKFRYRRLLITHWKMQHNLKCRLCFKNFVTHLELRKHAKVKHKIKFETSKTVKQPHVENKVSVGHEQKYTCKICKHSLNTAHLLLDHMKIHKRKCFQCENCKKNFLYFRNWMFHMRQNICLKYFDNTNGMTHLNCLVCKKEFGTVQSLITHMRQHNTIHKCAFCYSKFKQKDLQEHINRQHPGEVKYACDKCSLRFCFLNDLFKHKKYSHKAVVIKEEPTEEFPRNTDSAENNVKSDEDHQVWIKQESTNLQ